MARKKTASKKKAKKYQLEFSLGTMFFWCLGLFFLLAWIFVLGILVGKGMLSHRMENLSVQEKQPAGPHQAKRGQTSPASDTIMRDMMGLEEKKPEFTFYKELTSKKEAAAKKVKKDIKKKRDDHRVAKKEEAKTPKISLSGKTLPKKSRAGTRQEARKEQDKPVTEKDEPVRDVASTGDYTVQVASLSSEIEAMKMANSLTADGYNAYYLKSIINGKEYYRVRCGRFKDRNHAERLKSKLAQKEKISGFVTVVNK